MRSFVFALCALSMLCALPVKAEEDFGVNIKVDVTDENSSAAQQKAMAGASKAAVVDAVKRISDQSGVEKISSMNNDQLMNFIKETSVSDEKTSTNRYMANLRLVVNMDLLKEYMRERQIYISDIVIPSVVVIPVFSEFSDDAPLLWEVGNLWKKAWDNTNIDSKINFIVIKDTPVNISTISAQQARSLDAESLNEIKKFHNADDVYVLLAAYNGIEGLNIEITSLSGQRLEHQVKGSKSSGEELFNQAVSEILPLLEKQVEATITEEDVNTSQQATVLFPFDNLGDWVAAEGKIKAIPGITDFQVQAFSPGKVQFTVSYQGDIDSLKNSFRASGYQLDDGGNYLILSYIGD